MIEGMLISLVVVFGSMLVLWGISLAISDASIVDIFWGPGFALVAAANLLSADEVTARGLLAAGLTAAWGLRLGAYLAWRNLGHGEDARYVAMRRRHGDRFARVSLISVFGLQGVVMWTVSWPVQWAIRAPAGSGLGWVDLLSAAVVCAGLTFESLGDFQLARFKADPAHRGKVMDRGLWSWTRHPNYFGDFLVWWGLFGVAAASGGAWTIVSPALMSVFLIRISGKALLERRMARSKPGWDEYVARVSGFFPRPPRAS
jgi:steroid 5-alpha reductase family enzyme